MRPLQEDLGFAVSQGCASVIHIPNRHVSTLVELRSELRCKRCVPEVMANSTVSASASGRHFDCVQEPPREKTNEQLGTTSSAASGFICSLEARIRPPGPTTNFLKNKTVFKRSVQVPISRVVCSKVETAVPRSVNCRQFSEKETKVWQNRSFNQLSLHVQQFVVR